jgi:hypothetical protein
MEIVGTLGESIGIVSYPDAKFSSSFLEGDESCNAKRYSKFTEDLVDETEQPEYKSLKKVLSKVFRH